jgi:glycosyltransferase involved in cell wall biosynthesis
MISIVIPLYNKAESIARTVSSVLAQTESDWELIVVDDGSKDNGPDIVQQFNDPRIKLDRQANAGVSAARNRGIGMANNEIIAFLDADDYWAPNHLENLNLIIKEFPLASMYATAYFEVHKSGKLNLKCFKEEHSENDAFILANLFQSMCVFGLAIQTSAVAIKKDAFAQIEGFPVDIDSGEDIITWARLACNGQVAYSKKATSYYDFYPPIEKVRSKAIRRPQKFDYVGIELAKLAKLFPEYKLDIIRFLGDWHRIRAMQFLELGEKIKCIFELKSAIKITSLKSRDILSFFSMVLPRPFINVLLRIWRFSKIEFGWLK